MSFGAVSDRVDFLVRADYLYPMSDGAPVIVDGEVAVLDGRIVYAGPRRGDGTWVAAEALDGRGRALLPGFVNCHTHAASVVFRSQTDDCGGGGALYTVAFRMEKDIGPEEWGDLAWLGCVDMIRAGVTTINDLWYRPDLLATAVEATGLRAVIANKVFDVRLEELHRGDYTRYPAAGEARLRVGVELVERWHGRANGRITARLGPHATDTCDAGLHREARREATRFGVGLHVHAAQSRREVAEIERAHGTGPLEYLRDLGCLAPDVVLAHLTFAGDRDLEAVRETGASYAHCPIIYPRRGVYPRLSAIRQLGIPTGLATDWMQNDPFEGMRNAVNATRLLRGDPDALPTREALWLHSRGAARALGLEAEIGSLETGKRADMIQVALDRPHLQPFYGDYAALVFYAKVSDVVTSIVDGHVILRDGRLVGVDEAAVLERVARRIPGWGARLRALGGSAITGDGGSGGAPETSEA